ncbi:MAG: hypothetical protein JSR54_16320 [Proteobacteria bacterium]|nr:hypothetical protein [Pseudomonadota bacterium]
MTVREALRRRYGAILATAVFAGLWVVGWGRSSLTLARPEIGLPVMLLGLVPAVLGWRSLRRVQCPRCRGRLDRHMNLICFGALHACPHCQLPFDAPMIPPRG